MPKSITLGNGSVLVGLDRFGQVKDLYYHYAGLENHVSESLAHKIGVFIEDRFSWVDSGSWEISVLSKKSTMASDITMKNEELGLELKLSDVVYNEKDIFLREVHVKNLFERKRKLKLYFNQQFNISQTDMGDTAFYDPRGGVIIHYKGRRVFLINSLYKDRGFDDYSVGLLGIEGKDGTYKDAEDGELTGNPIEHGTVDSVIEVNIDIPPNEEEKVYYWICIAKSIDKVKSLNEEILGRDPNEIIISTTNYWKAWVNVQNFSFYGLGDKIIDLFKTSLFNIRSHVSQNGAIIASGDSEMLQFGRDYYEYVWPRDAAFAAVALEKSGDFNASRRFFAFCNETITNEGFFMHKYRPDMSLGSSWHPWVSDGRKQFPIQEDETAVVMTALWKHYELSRDIEFIEGVYNSLIKRAAEFMVSFRDDKTGLPEASYDIWEQHYGVHTYTAASVYGALNVCSRFAELLGKSSSSEKYKSAADDIKKAILKYLYDKEEGVFYKRIMTEDKKDVVDKTIDFSSFYGVYKYQVLEPEDEKLKKAMEKTVERLEVKTKVGGIARYEGDSYNHVGGDYPGNPWIITAMWLAQYHIDLAKKESDMKEVRKWISWAVKYAGPSGTLPEQLHPETGEHLSASPLVWSHAEYVTTIVNYLEKLEELGVCKACYPIS